MISSTLMIFLIPDIATVFFGTYTYPFLLLTKSLWLKSSKGLASSMHNLSPYFNLALRCLFFFGPQPRTLLLFRVQVTVFWLVETFTSALAVVLRHIFRHITRKFSSDSLWNLSTSARFVLYCVALFKFSYYSLQFLTVGKCSNSLCISCFMRINNAFSSSLNWRLLLLARCFLKWQLKPFFYRSFYTCKLEENPLFLTWFYVLWAYPYTAVVCSMDQWNSPFFRGLIILTL